MKPISDELKHQIMYISTSCVFQYACILKRTFIIDKYDETMIDYIYEEYDTAIWGFEI